MNKQLFSGRPEGSGTHRRPRLGAWRWIFLVVAVAMSLACMTLEIGFNVVHQEDREDQATFKIAQHLTDKYIEAAKKANEDLRKDYAEVDKEPSFEFPETMQGLSGEMPELTVLDPKTLPGEFEVKEDASGFTATATFTLPELLRKQEESGQKWLQVEEDDPEGIRYIFELDLPAMGDPDEDPQAMFDAFEQLRREGMPPKPKLEKVDEDKIEEEADKIAEELKAGRPVTETRALTLSGFDRLIGGLLAGTGGLLEGADLEMWYALRIMRDAGAPEFRWWVELPGEIVAYTVDGQTEGVVEGNRVTLVMDKDFFRKYGSGEHRFRVESVLNPCHDICAERPHQIWDGESVDPCNCICEKGWEMMSDGECKACQDLCPQWDHRAEYDPENSQPNKCACKCVGKLLRFEWGVEKGECTCVPGARPVGDECECREGLTRSVWGDRCISEEEKEESSVERNLRQLFDMYKEDIPWSVIGRKIQSGEIDSFGLDPGIINNLRGGYWVCGEYQDYVLKWLDSIRTDPEQKRLLEGLDYGPIEMYWGGHQAVVIYRRGTDWRKTGIVLDPWLYQRPEYWQIEDWAKRFHTLGGPGASSTYGGMYPHLHGGEPDYESGPAGPPIRPKHKKRAVVRSPVDVLIVGEGGQRIGRLPDGTFVNEMPGADFVTHSLPDGTLAWYFGLLEGRHEMTLTGTGSGYMHLLTSSEEGVIQNYGSQPINPGEQAAITLDPANPLAPLRLPSGEEVIPTTEELEFEEAPEEPYEPERPVTLGDGDGDGLCTEVDAQVAMQMAMGRLAEDLKMDVDQDGRVTESDALQILGWAAAGGQCQAGAVEEVGPSPIPTATPAKIRIPIPTVTAEKVHIPVPTVTPTQVPPPTPIPTATPVIMCTPPLCNEGEVYYCEGDCPGGCGVRCATPTPPAAPTPFFSPQAIPGQAIEHPEIGLAFRSHAVLPSPDGDTLTAFGEVENISNGPIETGYYQLWFTPYDAAGQVIQTEYDLVTDLPRPVLAPGQKSPFRDSVMAGIEVSEDFMERIDHYVVEIRPTGQGQSGRFELSVQNLAWSPGAEVTGLVLNDTQFTVDRYGPSVWLTLYDASGWVIDVTSAFTEYWFLAPGETMPFSSWFNIPSEVASLDVLAWGYPAQGLIFYDDFSDPASGWETYSEEYGEVRYEEGALALAAKGREATAAVRCPGIQPQDFDLSFEATPLSEPGDWQYGVDIRRVPGGNAISFSLTADGRYSVYEAVDGKVVSWGDDTPSEAIETSGTNRIAIYAYGPSLTFYVNGERLAEVTDAPVREGEIILWVYSPGEQEVKVAFDNVVVEGEEPTATPTPASVAMLAPTPIPTPPLAEAALAQPVRNEAAVQRWVYQSLDEDMNNNGERDYDDNELYVRDQATGQDTRLTHNQFGDALAAWSPSGELIAFVSNRDGDETEIYVMARDGSNPVRLTSDGLWDGWPNWSPSGQAIFYLHATEPGLAEKYEIRSLAFQDGRPTAEQTVLTLPPADDYGGPWFLLDSEAIVFELCDYTGDQPRCVPWRYDLPQAGYDLPGAPQPVRLEGDFEIYDQSAFPWLIISWAEYRGF